ncbi:MAG: bifunctional 5,10-methylenetetrahydrofolate dehydrogenase/5,10-methenyltetrahydrofolate cyclohydrolase, partial [Thermoguttaceae bacterium]|nr:bifunctional 5,10-methylenetetrahydrofolate dehydrogenase/5,10-methenyltetrahydrofolate cyclohydrolase [Thermoguttaceae bacterium]
MKISLFSNARSNAYGGEISASAASLSLGGKFHFVLFRVFVSRHIAHLVVPRRFDLFARQAFRAAEIAPRYDRVCEIGAGDVARLETRGRKILRRKIAARQIALKRYVEELKKEISTLKRKPGLAVIQVGDNPASNVYVSNKEKTGLELGCNFEYIKFPEDVQEDLILATIDRLNDDMSIDGIIVQLPLPEHLNKEKIQNRVCHKKDVDGLTDINAGLLMHNKDCLVPCTPNGILEILKYYDISVSGKNVVIVGRSELVGRPMFSLMLNNNATVTICHSYTS